MKNAIAPGKRPGTLGSPWTWLRAAVTVLTLATLFHVYEPQVVVTQMARLWPDGLVVACMLLALCTMAMALKWQVLLPRARYRTLLRAITVSYFYSLLPIGQLGGEMSKLAVLRAAHVQLPQLVASIVFDKLTGLLALLLIGLAATLLSTGAEMRALAWVTGAMAMAVSVAILVSRVFSFAAPGQSPPLPQPSGLRALASKVGELFGLVSRYSADSHGVTASLLLGFLSQGLVIGIYLLIAAYLELDVGPVDLAAVVVLANVAALIPVSIAGIGIREASLTFLLPRFSGVAGDQALALSLIFSCVLLVAALVGAMLELRDLLGRR